MRPFYAPGLALLLTVTLGVAVTGFAHAQSSAAPKSSPGAATPATPAADTSEPKAKVTGSFGNWTLLCGDDVIEGKTQERCSLVQPLVEKDSNKLVFRIILTYGPNGRLILRVDGPTGIALQRGVEFSPDTEKVYTMPFQTCLPLGCKALMLVEDSLRQELIASKEGSITVYALNGSPVRTLTSLDGFTAGLAALDKHMGAQ